MRKIFLFVVLISIAVQISAQQVQYFSKELNYKDSITKGVLLSGGGLAYTDTKGRVFSIGVYPDERTGIYYPVNKINDLTNLAYFSNSEKVGLSFSVSPYVSVDQLRYRIIRDGDTSVWQMPNGKIVRQNEPLGKESTNIFMPDVSCKKEVIKIQLYDIANPESVLTMIVSTIPILKPELLSDVLIYNPMINMISKQKGADFSMNLNYGFIYDFYEIKQLNVFVNTNNTPYAYNLQLIEIGAKDTVNIKIDWKEIETSRIKSISYFSNSLINSFEKTYWSEIPVYLIKKYKKYEMRLVSKFRNSKNEEKIASNPVTFEVHKYISDKEKIFRILIPTLLIGLLGAISVMWYSKFKQKKTIQQQIKLTTEAKLKLQSIRSQLNPHFIFNALSGIQNLMHKNETDKANHYLNTFSRLTRNVLDDANKETISLDSEIKLLDDYLKMEQLRFGFQYSIHADEKLDRHNIEIPAMLLQPFAENAVKHGIASLKQNGEIKIDFKKSGNDLIMSVTDNGGGFDASKDYDGMGLTLSKNRITLLNAVHKETPLQLQIHSSQNGTEAIITLQNWLS